MVAASEGTPFVVGAPATSGPASERRAETASWTAAARDGDRSAFERLHDRLAPMVHAVLLARGPARDVDDLVQEVFLSGWRALSGLRDDEHVGAWLAAIARKAAARHHGRARPMPGSLPDDLADERPPDERPLGESLGSAEILAELRGLPEAYRETLMMRLVNGLSGPEIADATGLTPDSVRVNLSRGMKLLRERLSRLGWP